MKVTEDSILCPITQPQWAEQLQEITHDEEYGQWAKSGHKDFKTHEVPAKEPNRNERILKVREKLLKIS